MKKLFKANIGVALCFLATACGQALQVTPSPVVLTTTVTTIPTFTSTPSPTATATIRPTDTPFPTLLPTIESTLIPDLLHSSIVVKTLDGINGRNLKRITGWKYGFYPSSFCYRPDWLDNENLLLFPIVGQGENFGTYTFTNPIVINYKSGKLWIPPIPQNISGGRTCPIYNFIWSEALGFMVMIKNGKVGAYSPDGNLLQTFAYDPDALGVILSPSGTKAVAAGDIWIDLQTGKVVKIRSNEEIGFSAWSSDETQLFSCCYYYGNVNTGKGYKFEFNDGLNLTGRGGPLPPIDIEWVGDDTYALIGYDFRADGFVDIPFIDPVAKTYKDIHDLTDIPKENYCSGRFDISPNKEYLWTHCGKQGYLINLDNFETKTYGDLWLTTWSKDSQFAIIGEYNSEQQQVLSISSQKLNLLPTKSIIRTLMWHPTDGTLAYLGKDGLTLITVDAQSWSIRETKMPSTFHDIVWSPNGDHIALVAEDGSLWQIDYPKLETLEQLTSPLPSYVGNVSWSPDEKHITFTSGKDIYIVDTVK